jgi:hypothetical protein
MNKCMNMFLCYHNISTKFLSSLVMTNLCRKICGAHKVGSLMIPTGFSSYACAINRIPDYIFKGTTKTFNTWMNLLLVE